MTRIYLVRHGTTDWNREEIFRGRIDCPLNETGREEARALARAFQEIALDAVCSSPLSRAKETAQAVAESYGLPVIAETAFLDIDFGAWHGLPLREVREKYPELYRTWREKPQTVTFPGGEGLTQVRDRAWEGLLGVARRHEGQTVLIVTHRVVTKVLICTLLGLDISHFWEIKQDTTAVNCFEYQQGRFVTSLINDTCHLKAIRKDGGMKDF